jgi:hypothetical protein
VPLNSGSAVRSAAERTVKPFDSKVDDLFREEFKSFRLFKLLNPSFILPATPGRKESLP